MSGPPAEQQKSESKRRLGAGARLASLALISVGAVIVIAASASLLYFRALNSPGDAPLPDSLAGFKLQASSYGDQALDEVSRLHGKSFPLISGSVGWYGFRNEVTLWTAGAVTGIVAAKMIDDMETKIGQGNSPFIPTRELVLDRRSINELSGMGQRHFFFQAGSLVIWLAADPELADQALAEALRFYQ
jgi:hypothetical protein